MIFKIKIKKVEGRLYLRSTFKNLLRLFRRNALRHTVHHVFVQGGQEAESNLCLWVRPEESVHLRL